MGGKKSKRMSKITITNSESRLLHILTFNHNLTLLRLLPPFVLCSASRFVSHSAAHESRGYRLRRAPVGGGSEAFSGRRRDLARERTRWAFGRGCVDARDL